MPRPAPIQLMKVALLGSTGAFVTSTFHQLSAGKRGRGPGSGPPWTACARAAAGRKARNPGSRKVRTRSLEIAVDVEDQVGGGRRVVQHENRAGAVRGESQQRV